MCMRIVVKVKMISILGKKRERRSGRRELFSKLQTMGEIEKTISIAAEYVSRLRHRGYGIHRGAFFFYFKFVAYSGKLSEASQLDNYHRRIRASLFCREKESLSRREKEHLSLSLFLFSLPGDDFQPPSSSPYPSLIPSLVKSREFALSIEGKWHRRSKVSRARRFTPNRITYHANASRSNKSASPVQFILSPLPLAPPPSVPFSLFVRHPVPSFAHRHFFPHHCPFVSLDLSGGSMSRMHLGICL